MRGRINVLLNNTLIFGLGTIFSKFFQYLLLIIITYKLTTAEYGTADLIIQAYTILFPVVSLDMSEALLRFVMNKDYRQEKVLSTVIFIDVVGSLICILLGAILCFVLNEKSSIVTVIILTIINVFYWSFREYTRGVNKYKAYSFGAVLGTLFQVLLCLVFVFLLELGLRGYMYSIGISLIVELIFYVNVSGAWNNINIKNVDLRYAVDLIKYSLPLIPNAICWWIVSVSDRYMVTFFIDESANGLYAVASKIPALLTLLSTFFIQAWQTSSISAVEDKESNEFFERVYNALVAFVLICGALGLLIVKSVMLTILPENYHAAWLFVPVLMVAAIFNVIQSFLSTILLATNKTVKVFLATVIAAVLNIVLNTILIPYIGVQGACISTFISFITLCFFRQYTLKDFIKLNIIKKYCVTMVFLIIEMFFVLSNQKNIYSILLSIIVVLMVVMLNKKKSRDTK